MADLLSPWPTARIVDSSGDYFQPDSVVRGVGGIFSPLLMVTDDVDVTVMAANIDNFPVDTVQVWLKNQSPATENGLWTYTRGTPSTFTQDRVQPQPGDMLFIDQAYDGTFTPGIANIIIRIDSINEDGSFVPHQFLP